jgi:hypothetical protein
LRSANYFLTSSAFGASAAGAVASAFGAAVESAAGTTAVESAAGVAVESAGATAVESAVTAVVSASVFLQATKEIAAIAATNNDFFIMIKILICLLNYFIVCVRLFEQDKCMATKKICIEN